MSYYVFLTKTMEIVPNEKNFERNITKLIDFVTVLIKNITNLTESIGFLLNLSKTVCFTAYSDQTHSKPREIA